MQSIYTSGTSNYGMAGLYAPAGIVNISTSSYNINGQQEPFYKKSDGTIITNSTLTNTSIVQQLVNNIGENFELITNTSYIAQHIDYQQNGISDPAGFATNPETAPNQPDNININIIDDSSVLITFDPVSNAKYYTIYYSISCSY
jgi:glutamine phosphoribosylpyrophosphate amidotransferase